MSDGLLMTGATGFVGMEVLGRYLEQSDDRIFALVRAGDDAAAAERVRATLRDLFGLRARRYENRVVGVAADLLAPELGLSPARRVELARQVNRVVHIAASVSFALPLDEARAINREGTNRVLELAELAKQHGGLERYAHVSTAYVAGTHRGRFFERDLDVSQAFRNSYEQAKFEAEELVRGRSDLPTTILRPSIIVGDRNSGWTSAFNVLYWPLRAFARGLYPVVPAVPSTPVDVVSIDFVADAVHELCRSGVGIGHTYHLTAGVNASSVAELVELASHYFKRPPPQVLTPVEFEAYMQNATGLERSVFGRSAEYFPYFALSTEFDNAAARAVLEPVEIAPSPLRSYISRLLDFAVRSRWGKRPIARSEAAVA
ncbi:MAG TPA: SDR family oxidoreductase [Solirubrobacteraceae bacterium]